MATPEYMDGFLTSKPQQPAGVIPAPPGSLAASLGGSLPSQVSIIEGAVHVNEKEEEILKGSLSADEIEARLTRTDPVVLQKFMEPSSSPKMNRIVEAVGTSYTRRPNRGEVMRHRPSKKKVVVVKPDSSVTPGGEIRHTVMMFGGKRKFEVPEKNLEFL